MSDGTVPADFCYTPWSTVYGICPSNTPGVVKDNCQKMCKDVPIPGNVCNLTFIVFEQVIMNSFKEAQ